MLTGNLDRFMWAFNWGWWLEAINDIHAIVNAHIIATYKELDERDLARKNGQELGPERTDLLWIMAQQMRNDLEGLRSRSVSLSCQRMTPRLCSSPTASGTLLDTLRRGKNCAKR